LTDLADGTGSDVKSHPVFDVAAHAWRQQMIDGHWAVGRVWWHLEDERTETGLRQQQSVVDRSP